MALALVVVLGLPAATAQAAFPGKNGKIAYRKYSVYPDPDNPNGDYITRGDIWAMDPKGSGDTNLTKTADGDFLQPSDPAFSPDGTEIAYEGPDSPYNADPNTNYCGRSTDIFVMNAGGTDQRNITNTFAPPDLNTCAFDPLQAESDPAFSADGTKVAYVRGDNEIFVISAAGSSSEPPVRLTFTGDDEIYVAGNFYDPTGDNSDPTFSPDGKKIAFLRSRPDGSKDVWVMDLDTQLQTLITDGTAAGPVLFDLDYSPDGTKFVYERNNETGSISVMNSADGALVKDTGVAGGEPVFSPDGTKIAYAAGPDPVVEYDSADIWVMDADGTNRLDVTSAPRAPFFNGPNYETGPAWQPIPGAAGPTAPPPATITPPGATPPAATIPDTVRPVLNSLSLSRTGFRVASSGPSISAAVGTRVSYKLSEKASVKFRVERAFPGRLTGGTCVRPTRSNTTKRPCTRYVTLRGSFTHHRGKAGPNSVKFSGRLSGRKLRPGRYRLRAVATDPAKNRSARKRVRFRIVKR